ncbi:MAG: pirin family protein [Hyphomonadaceae bacterium]|nr:pirin family protein [Hyphomonadaceae bacterium]
MIEVRPFSSLGGANHGWLDAHHHFSFAEYYDPKRTSWGKLRVWNDDIIQPKSGFPPHPHRDMEIITYVRTGAITHQDSMGNKGRTAAGDVQVMSAGTGVRHAEYNLEDEPTTIFQIWIEPDKHGQPPGWGAKQFPKSDRSGAWSILASGKGDDGALGIRADARVLGATIETGQELAYDAEPGRHVYAVLATGIVEVNGQRLSARDGVAISDTKAVFKVIEGPAEIVLTDTL